MATTLTCHVTRLPAILLVICLCWGVTLGQDVNSSSTAAPSDIMGNLNSSVTAAPQALPDPTVTPTTTVQTTLSTTVQTTPTTTSPSTSKLTSMLSSTSASTTPTTVTTTVSSTTMESTSTSTPSTTVSSTTPSTTVSSTTPSTTVSTTTPSTTVSSTTPSTTVSTTTPSTTVSSTTPSTTVSSTTPSTTVSSTTPSTTVSSTTAPTTVSSTTPSTTMSTTTPSTTVSSTTPSTTVSTTTPSTTMSTTTPSTTMSTTTPSTTMSSTMIPSTTSSTTILSTTAPTTMSSTTPLSKLDPTAAPVVKSAGTTAQARNSTEVPISIPGVLGGGTSTASTASQTEFKTASMKPMVTDTTVPPVSTGVPTGTQRATAVTISADNATAVVARTTGPKVRQTSGPTVPVRGSLPPVIPTTQYPPGTGPMRTSKRPDLQSTTAYRPASTDASSVTTARMTAPPTQRMTQIMKQTTAVVPLVKTSQLRTTSMPISSAGVTTPVAVMTAAPTVAKTTKITRPVTRKVTTRIPTAPVLPTTMVPEMPKDVTYSIRFDGDCSVILSMPDVREKFEQNFIETFSAKLGVPKDNILIEDISCGSVVVLVTLMGIQQSKVERNLDTAVVSQPVPLVVNADGGTYVFNPNSYKVSAVPAKGASTEAPATELPDPDPTGVGPRAPPSGLRSVDMIIIIVVSIIGGLLIIIIIALIIHECRRRSHTKSFDLRGTPRPHIHTEDFTLTKMERGPAEYNDYGLVVNSTSNGQTRTPQVGVATIVETPKHHNGDAMHNGYHKTAKEEYEPEYDAGPDSPSISLMKSMRTPHIEGGIENPSFSSEDILDSGTETDKEMVSSDKGLDSPDHAPLQVYPPAESDSGRQSDSLTEIPYDTPPQHSPRSTLSDNTGSDHTYEPFEAPPTPDIPHSPIHHEVLMPIEEVGYPNEETEASSPPHSPGSPDVLSHSPENGSYEMVETRSPGKRESDFFAPAEGATAF